MKSTMPVILILAALWPAGRAVAEGDDAVEAAYYRAYYLEVARRDFEAAVGAYEQALTLAPEGEDGRRARLGRARCLKALGRLEEAAADLRAILLEEPDHPGARDLLAEVETKSGDGDLDERLRGLVSRLGDNALAAQATQDLLLAGEAAVPVLSEGLRNWSASVVTRCGLTLIQLGSPAALDALAAAVRDDEVGQKDSLGSVFKSLPPTLAGQAVFRAAFEGDDPGLRMQAVRALASRASAFADEEETARGLRALVALAASDSKAGVRHEILAKRWPDSVAPTLVPLARELLESDVKTLRQDALRTIGRMPGLRAAMVRQILGLVLEDPSAEIRREALKLIAQPGGAPEDVRRQAVLRAVGDPDDALVVDALAWSRYLESLESAPGDEWIDGVLAVARRAVGSVETYRRLWSGAWGALSVLPPSRLGAKASDLLDLVIRSRVESARLPESDRDQIRDQVCSVLSMVPEAERDRVGAMALERLPTATDRGIWLRWLRSRGAGAAPVSFRSTAAAPDPAVRRESYLGLLELLGRDDVVPALPYLAADLRDPGRYLSTVNSIPYARPALDPESLAAVAMRLVTEHPDRANVDVLRAFWSESEDYPARTAARRALVAVLGKGAEAEVRADLADPRYRSGARGQLREMIDAGAVPEFVEYAVERRSAMTGLSGTWQWATRHEGGEAVRYRNSTLSTAFIDRYLTEIPEDLVSADLIAFLAAPASPGPRRRLILAGLESADAPTRAAAAERAGAYNMTEAWPRLVALLDGPQVDVRRAAKRALEEIRSYRDLRAAYERFGPDDRAAALDRATALITNPDPAKRRGAAFALGALGDAAAVPALLKLLADEDERVREAALSALERLGGRKDD